MGNTALSFAFKVLAALSIIVGFGVTFLSLMEINDLKQTIPKNIIGLSILYAFLPFVIGIISALLSMAIAKVLDYLNHIRLLMVFEKEDELEN